MARNLAIPLLSFMFMPAAARGVGSSLFCVRNDPNSVSTVWGIDGTSWNNERFCGVINGLQVIEHRVEAQRDEAKHIFTKHPTGPCFLYNSSHFSPERAVVVFSSSFSAERERLTRKSPCDEVKSFELSAVECFDVVMYWHPGKVFA